jgi:hypothetical protein
MSNNFKELEKLTIQNRVRSQEETKQKINSNIHFFGFVSTILDLYVPQIGKVISASFQSPSSDLGKVDKSKYPNQE